MIHHPVGTEGSATVAGRPGRRADGVGGIGAPRRVRLVRPPWAPARGSRLNHAPGAVRCTSMGTAAAADERLMRELYDMHAAVLLGYVRRLVGGDQARAEDVVQETLLRAWRHPEALDPHRAGGASVRAWLLTVARHLVIDGERARRARPREVPQQPDSAAVAPCAHDPAGPDDELDRILLAHGMADALQTLTADHRPVVEQLYYRDRTVADAARVLGVPEGTVKSRAYYALRALRVACEERGLVP